MPVPSLVEIGLSSPREEYENVQGFNDDKDDAENNNDRQ